MNDNGSSDDINGTGPSSGITTAEETAWAQCFVQVVKTMRLVSGANFLFDWNVNACVSNIPLESFYPGNAYVDIIGVDQYDAFCNGSNPPISASRWSNLMNEPDASNTSLDAIAAFAQQNGKPLSIPEWGLTSTGDDPYFVQGMAAFIASNNVAYQSYFDSGTAGILQLGSATPQATAAYISAFG